MLSYEFRFFDEGILLAVHTAECNDDQAARQRARAYLQASDEFDAVIIRSGDRFVRQVGVEFANCEAIAKPVRSFT